jgi:hypothetical protein
MPSSSRVTPAAVGRLFAGWLLVISGGILTPLPIPVGLLSLSLGLALLAHDSRRMQCWIRGLRQRFPGLSRRLVSLGNHAPAWLARVIRHTEP